MKRKLTVALLFVIGVAALAGARQEDSGNKPFTKDQIIRALSGKGEVRMMQGELAAEVERRGIGFGIDDNTLQELRNAGAKSFLLDTIKRVAEEPKNVPRLVDRTHDNPGEAPAPESGEDAKPSEAQIARLPFIEQARYHALEFTTELPNFIVTQVVTRYIEMPPAKDWRLEDTLEIELTYVAGKGEQYKVLRINGKPNTQSYDDLGGSTSSGELGTLLAAAFVPQSQATFKEAKKEQFHGRSTVVYDFKVLKENSRSEITDKNSHKTIIAGYSGSIWIDAETKRVLRIEQSHESIPKTFPITLAENSVEYDWVTISGERFLLPVRAEVILGVDATRQYNRNLIEFKNYHKYEGNIKITDGE